MNGWGRGATLQNPNDPAKGLISSDSLILDGRGRIKVSNQQLIFENKLPYGKSTTLWGEAVGGAGTSVHDPANSCVDMTTFDIGDYVVRQTKSSNQYQAGNIMQCGMTGSLTPESGCEKQIGMSRCSTVAPHPIDDGAVFEMIDGVHYCTIYKNGVATERVERSNWDDPLDGTGESKISIDLAKIQLFSIGYLWQGVGNVYFYIFANGYYYLAHSFTHVNQLDQVYMRTGSHPLIYRLYSTIEGERTMKQICTTVEIEGGSAQQGIAAAVDMDIIPVTITTDLVALIGVRLKATNLDAVVDILEASMISLTNDAVRTCFCWNPINIAGTPPVWTGVTGGSIEVFYGNNTNLILPSIQFDAKYFSRDSQQTLSLVLSQLPLGSDVDGTPDEIFLCAQAQTGNATVLGGMNVRQLV